MACSKEKAYVCTCSEEKNYLKKNAHGQGSLLPMSISLVQSFPPNVLAFLPQIIKNHRMQKHYTPKSNCYQKLLQSIKLRVYL